MIADTWPSALIILVCAFVLLPLLVGLFELPSWLMRRRMDRRTRNAWRYPR